MRWSSERVENVLCHWRCVRVSIFACIANKDAVSQTVFLQYFANTTNILLVDSQFSLGIQGFFLLVAIFLYMYPRLVGYGIEVRINHELHERFERRSTLSIIELLHRQLFALQISAE